MNGREWVSAILTPYLGAASTNLTRDDSSRRDAQIARGGRAGQSTNPPANNVHHTITG